MRIKPTKEQMARAGNKSFNCPYYQAIVDACPELPKYHSVNVGSDDLVISGKGYALPFDVKAWIRMWDHNYKHLIFTPIESPPEWDFPELDEICASLGIIQ